MSVNPLHKLGEQWSHWLGEDGRINYLTFQGNCLTWKVCKPLTNAPITKKRGQVTTFSSASRLRILKLIAQINWTKAEPCLFVTLTFPDASDIRHSSELNQARHEFWRYVEKHLRRHVTAIWRIEWKIRLTGARIGEAMPHFHFIVFNVRWIDCWDVNEWWKKSIGHQGYVRTETKKMKNANMAAAYVAKYCAKQEDGSLVNAAYLNIPNGRNWGILRKNLLPVHPRIRLLLHNSDVSDAARAIGIKGIEEWLHGGNESFTRFGPTVAELWAFLERMGFDGEQPFV